MITQRAVSREKGEVDTWSSQSSKQQSIVARIWIQSHTKWTCYTMLNCCSTARVIFSDYTVRLIERCTTVARIGILRSCARHGTALIGAESWTTFRDGQFTNCGDAIRNTPGTLIGSGSCPPLAYTKVYFIYILLDIPSFWLVPWPCLCIRIRVMSAIG